jgi:hypothetical protein
MLYLNNASFFIDVVSGYGCDFALFPELTAPLMAYNHLSEAEAIRELARTYRSYSQTI